MFENLSLSTNFLNRKTTGQHLQRFVAWFLFVYLGVQQQDPVGFEEVAQALLCAVERQRAPQERQHEQERQRGSEVEHSAGRADRLPQCEVYEHPGEEQTGRQLPADHAHALDTRAGLQHFPTEKVWNVKTSKESMFQRQSQKAHTLTPRL